MYAQCTPCMAVWFKTPEILSANCGFWLSSSPPVSCSLGHVLKVFNGIIVLWRCSFFSPMFLLFFRICHVIWEVFWCVGCFAVFSTCFSFVRLVVWPYNISLGLFGTVLYASVSILYYWAAVVIKPHDDKKETEHPQYNPIWQYDILWLHCLHWGDFQDDSWERVFGWWFPWRFQW